jgi:hypothetical protein
MATQKKTTVDLVQFLELRRVEVQPKWYMIEGTPEKYMAYGKKYMDYVKKLSLDNATLVCGRARFLKSINRSLRNHRILPPDSPRSDE